MKRLLAYLFIILGLGLTFNVKAESKRYYCVHKDAKSRSSILQMYPEIFKKSKADYFRVQSKANCGYGNNDTFIRVRASEYDSLTRYFKRQQLREKYYKPDTKKEKGKLFKREMGVDIPYMRGSTVTLKYKKKWFSKTCRELSRKRKKKTNLYKFLKIKW